MQNIKILAKMAIGNKIVLKNKKPPENPTKNLTPPTTNKIRPEITLLQLPHHIPHRVILPLLRQKSKQRVTISPNPFCPVRKQTFGRGHQPFGRLRPL